MEPAVAFAVLLEVLQGHVAVFVEHAAGFKERFGILLEVVVIDKVVARVVVEEIVSQNADTMDVEELRLMLHEMVRKVYALP